MNSHKCNDLSQCAMTAKKCTEQAAKCPWTNPAINAEAKAAVRNY